jgi:hypothetical protein
MTRTMATHAWPNVYLISKKTTLWGLLIVTTEERDIFKDDEEEEIEE